MANMRTPLGKVRGLGSAKEGTDHFWKQRLTSVANVPLVLFFIGLIVALNGASYAQVHAALANPITALLLIAAMVSVLVHMRIGMQVIIEDYVHGEFMKIVLLMLNTFFAMAIAAISIFAILKVSFGG